MIYVVNTATGLVRTFETMNLMREDFKARKLTSFDTFRIFSGNELKVTPNEKQITYKVRRAR